MKNFLKSILTIILLLPTKVFADVSGDPMAGLQEAGNNTSLLKTTPSQIVAGVIRGVLTFLGTIFLVLILYAGFKWMTSRGNAEAVGEAKKIMGAAVIGLAITVSAYAITLAVFRILLEETAGGGAGTGQGGAN